MKTINVRQLQRNMKDIAAKVQQGESFVVLKNSDLIFQINPISNNFLASSANNKNKTTTLHDVFKNIQFSSGKKNLSKNIDKLIY